MFDLRCDEPRGFPINHAGGGSSEVLYTLSGVTFLASGTLFEPVDFRAPVAQGGTVGQARKQVWAGGGSATANVGAAGGGAQSEGTEALVGSEAVTVATAAGAGASGGPSSVGGISALGGQSPSGGTPGQGGQASGGTGSIRFSGGNGNQGAATQNGGGSAGSAGNGTTGNGSGGGPPNGGYSSLPGALSAWPGGGGGSTAGSANLGRPGLVRVTFQVPSLLGAPRIVDISEQRDTADALSRVVAAPVDREVGDLLVLMVSSHGTSAITAAAWADGSLAQVNVTAICGRAFYRTATGTAADDATVATAASEQCTSHMYVVKDAGGAPEWTTTTTASGNVGTIGHTNSFGYRPTLCILSAGLNQNNGVNITSFPNGFEGAMWTAGATTAASSGLVTLWRQFNDSSIVPLGFTNATVQSWSGTLVVPGVA